MWMLAGSIFAGCKWLTWSHRTVDAHFARHLSYLFAWAGLDADTFLDSRSRTTRPAVSELISGLGCLTLGITLFFFVARRFANNSPILVGWCGMLGITLVLHFGSFKILSFLFRSVGILARPLMNCPIAASGISDFWSHRWNTAFRDFTHEFVFRPVVRRMGPHAAIVAGFLFSGLVHDLVISVPAGGGFGLPTLYFVIQLAALFFERSSLGRRLRLSRGLLGRLFTVTVLIVPIGM